METVYSKFILVNECPAYWFENEKIRRCSIEARGLLALLVSVMIKSKNFGLFIAEDKRKAVNLLSGFSTDSKYKIHKYFNELEKKGLIISVKGGFTSPMFFREEI